MTCSATWGREHDRRICLDSECVVNCPECGYGDHQDCPRFGDTVERECCCGRIVHVSGCVGWVDHDGRCLTVEDAAEERLRASDFETWSRL